MKVIKIGGGCLKDGPAAGKIIKLIAKRGEGDIFVVSAFYGVTDILISGIEKALDNEDNIPSIITSLKTLHNTIIKSLIDDINKRKQLSKDLSGFFQKLERYYYGVSFTREATPRMKDMIATYGERISAHILSKSLSSMGKESCCLLPEDAGIISDGKFMDASALMTKTSRNLIAAMDSTMTPEKIVFIPGFYGMSESGDITTFGRGGSDYSAAVVAASIKADVLEIWKDTQGFMTADPDNIPHCKLIPELTYEEAAELSYTGAGILHPRTVEPVKKAGIDIVIKNTYHPNAPGSRITKNAYTAPKIIKSVSYTTDVSVLKIYATGIGARFGILSQITENLASSGINIKSVVTSQTCISLLLSRNDIEKGHQSIRKIRPTPYRKSSTITKVALVSIVGEGLQNNRGIAAKCFTAVSDANVNIEMISSGTSNAALYFLVHEDKLDTTINALHNIFFD
ncbi:MAG: aspartate kinase [Desulfobacula sp.]|uniref:aspartate kinase n=1 Tax=Desulfobacula sp. TaxID=2593537 RepID=UPI0025BC7D62|nr:aspartate kinase [Desulfobacula sp.]MCD4719647.1 aspartate kinase [Desulfobacula sp.]